MLRQNSVLSKDDSNSKWKMSLVILLTENENLKIFINNNKKWKQ